MTKVSDLFLYRQFRRFTDFLNLIEDGWPTQCRRATLDGEEVLVFGAVWPAGKGEDDPFHPTLLFSTPGVRLGKVAPCSAQVTRESDPDPCGSGR